MSLILYILVMALVAYLVRMIPFTLFRKEITSPFIRSLMYYLPYAVLSAMTIPSIFYATGNTASSVAGTLAALFFAYRKKPLIVVALAASASALIFDLIL